MRSSKIRSRWMSGEPAVSAWLSIGNSYSAEIIAASGVDAILVDLQHGMIDVQTMIVMLQAISATPATPLVRTGSLEPALIMKALDAGAYGIICPMIESVDEARQFVGATLYPPEGIRSFGPARGLLYGGPDYFEHANRQILRLAMIETIEGLAAVHDICGVEHLDGIFIGPNDLCLALGRKPVADPADPEVVSAINRCLEAAKSSGKHIGIFCVSGESAAHRIAQGFDFVVPGSDANLLKSAVAAELRATRMTDCG